MAVAALKYDKSNFVVDPCPQSGENIEIDVVVGLFRQVMWRVFLLLCRVEKKVVFTSRQMS